MNAAPEILDFVRTEGNTVGTVWRGHPKLARSIPFGTGILSDGTSIQMLKMQNMRNTPSLKVQLERGETYVSLGFVDLQEVMEADVGGLPENGPIAWHGYDTSPIAVGRSKLILAMLEEDVPLDQILQIWFSTCISSETAKTLSAFCGKLRMLERDKDVGVLLDWWSRKSNSIKVGVSTDAWNKDRRNGAFTSIPLLLSKRDRVEYARYILTGQIFLAGAKDLTGNPTFLPLSHWDCVPPINESIFDTVNISGGELVSEGSLLASIEKRFLCNLATLRKRIKENQIKITLSVATISADNKAVLAEIKRLKPAAIEWSNIPDYFTIPQFFSIASECSVEGTRHSFHLMNWLVTVYGANVADYVPFRENYTGRNFNLTGFFNDSGGALPKLVEELKIELMMSQHQVPTEITQDLKAVVSLMNIMDISKVAFGFRYCDTYMKFMFESREFTKKEWKKAEMTVFGFSNNTVYASFEF